MLPACGEISETVYVETASSNAHTHKGTANSQCQLRPTSRITPEYNGANDGPKPQTIPHTAVTMPR